MHKVLVPVGPCARAHVATVMLENLAQINKSPARVNLHDLNVTTVGVIVFKPFISYPENSKSTDLKKKGNSMGRTLPSAAQQLLQEQAALGKFRRVLRRSDQLVLDDLFAAAHKHVAEAAYASHALPFEMFLLSMLLEEHEEVIPLRMLIENIHEPEYKSGC